MICKWKWLWKANINAQKDDLTCLYLLSCCSLRKRKESSWRLTGGALSSQRGRSFLQVTVSFLCVRLPIVMIMFVIMQFVGAVRWSTNGKAVRKSSAQRNVKIHVTTNFATSKWRRDHTGLVGIILMGLIGRWDPRDASAAERSLLGTMYREIIELLFYNHKGA